ncbi:MAG TPA: hypothetical protein VFL13_01140 [Candidatus Baltobacteraceae bacterium]|nr:hypothetical protein [Candidatus Baltobacteraceae bacterium]
MFKRISILAGALALASCGIHSTPPVQQPADAPIVAPPQTVETQSSGAIQTTATVPVNSSKIISAEENFINGNRFWYTTGTASWSVNAGDTKTAPKGTAIDSIPCKNVSEGSQYPAGKYTQHVFVGIYYKGVEEALPQAVGMYLPKPPTTPAPPDWPNGHPNNTYAVELSQCRYNVHSHDYSGLVHVEDTLLAQSNTTMPSYATLKALFDIWGASITGSGINAGGNVLSGTVALYTGVPSAKYNGNDLIKSYTLFNGTAASLHFSKHMAVWIVIGGLPSGGLPEVQIVQTN